MPPPPPPRTGPLANVVCVDLTRQLAGPQASRILSDLGARVIKVEQTGSSGDLIEASPHYFAAVNHSKERVELDLRSDEGRTSFDAVIPMTSVWLAVPSLTLLRETASLPRWSQSWLLSTSYQMELAITTLDASSGSWRMWLNEVRELLVMGILSTLGLLCLRCFSTCLSIQKRSKTPL